MPGSITTGTPWRLKCDGLAGDQLRERAVPPSNLSLLGLVRHMAEVERQLVHDACWAASRSAITTTPTTTRTREFDDVAGADVAEAFETTGGPSARTRGDASRPRRRWM